MKQLTKQLTAALILLIATAFAGATQEKNLRPEQAALVATEQAFAKLAVERGVNESFSTYFADDGLAFGAQPFKVKESFKNAPAPTTESTIVLNWAPVYGDISQAGDLGYNTGPTVFEDHGPDKRPTLHGLFFSVWKKQSDGNWRVVIDMGAATPAAVAAINAPFRPASSVAAKAVWGSVDVAKESAALLKLDREFLDAAMGGTVGLAYQSRLSDDARVHRTNMMPTVGKDELRAWLAKQTMPLAAGEAINADVARSGDLGYVYGSYELAGEKPEKGYYARVWKRNSDGAWKIVLDTHSLIPPDKEAELNLAGYQLLGEKKFTEAIELFKRMVAEFPQSANACDSLSDAYEAAGEKKLAIKFAEKALELLPNDPSPNQDLKNRMKYGAMKS